jgi:dimethylargininase
VSLIALTRAVSPAMADCELTHLARTPIDVNRAKAQHAAYERALTALGCDVRQLPSGVDVPDAIFIEDVAVVLDEVAVITRPGAVSRQVEVPPVEAALAACRPIARIGPPGTMDGGDVLVVGRTIFIGRSGRTNDDGVAQFAAVVAPYGYRVQGIAVTGCLHLKSAVTALDDRTLLINRAWVAPGDLGPFEFVEVAVGEPWAANVVRVGGRILSAAAFPRTKEAIERRGFPLTIVDVSEIAKAEGAVTCCSLIFKA